MQIKRKSENCLFILADKIKTKQKINIRRYKKQKNKIVAVTFSPRSDRTAAFLNKKLCLLLIQIFYRDPSLMNLTMISCVFRYVSELITVGYRGETLTTYHEQIIHERYQTVQPFEKVKSGYSSITKESRECGRRESLVGGGRGVGACSPRKY